MLVFVEEGFFDFGEGAAGFGPVDAVGVGGEMEVGLVVVGDDFFG